LRHITGVDFVHQTAHCTEGRITEYRATVHVAFRVEHHSHILGASGQETEWLNRSMMECTGRSRPGRLITIPISGVEHVCDIAIPTDPRLAVVFQEPL
jgi:hypothetical protein